MEEYIKNCKIEFLVETIKRKRLTDEEYFSEQYKHFVSNSSLKLINPQEDGSYEKYLAGFESSYNPSFDLGTAVHQLTLQKEEFVLSNYDKKPSAKLGVFIDEVYKFRKKNLSIIEAMNRASFTADYYAGKLSPKIIKTALTKGLDYYLAMRNGLYVDGMGRGVVVLPAKQLEDCIKCIDSLKSNRRIQNALFGQNFFGTSEIYNEDAFFIDVLVTLPDGQSVLLPLKSKIDNWKIDPSENTVFLNDLKTTGKFIDHFMGNMVPILDEKGKQTSEYWLDGSFQKYHYYRQIAFYLLLLQMYCKTISSEKLNFQANIAAVQSFPGFSSQLINIPNKYVDLGKKELKELLCRVAWHKINGFDKEMTYDNTGN